MDNVVAYELHQKVPRPSLAVSSDCRKDSVWQNSFLKILPDFESGRLETGSLFMWYVDSHFCSEF